MDRSLRKIVPLAVSIVNDVNMRIAAEVLNRRTATSLTLAWKKRRGRTSGPSIEPPGPCKDGWTRPRKSSHGQALAITQRICTGIASSSLTRHMPSTSGTNV
jgi:hypothetical protein